MLYFVKTAYLGDVDRVDDTVIRTKINVINGVALFPESSIVLRTPEGGGEPTRIAIGLVGRSLVAAYLKNWAFLFALGFGLVGVAFGLGNEVVAAFACVVGGFAGAFGMRWLGNRIGRLSPVEQDKRRVYAAWLGPAADPALYGAEFDSAIDRLRGFVASRAKGSVADGYRALRQTRDAWFEAALETTDAALLGAAFTLARAETSRESKRADVRALSVWQKRLWIALAPRAADAAAVDGGALLETAETLPGTPRRVGPLLSSRAILVIVGAFASVGGAGFVYWVTHPSLYVTNLTERPRIEFFVDGKRFGDGPVANASLDTASRSGTVLIGAHELETRDVDTGEVLDRAHVRFGLFDRAVIYAPRRRADVCMFLERVVYEKYPSARAEDGSAFLDPTQSAWVLPASLDYWFETPPKEIQLSDGQTSATRWAAYPLPCAEREASPP